MELIAEKIYTNDKDETYYILTVPDSEEYSQEAIISMENKILELSKEYKFQPVIYDRRDNPFHKIVIFSK